MGNDTWRPGATRKLMTSCCPVRRLSLLSSAHQLSSTKRARNRFSRCLATMKKIINGLHGRAKIKSGSVASMSSVACGDGLIMLGAALARGVYIGNIVCCAFGWPTTTLCGAKSKIRPEVSGIRLGAALGSKIFIELVSSSEMPCLAHHFSLFSSAARHQASASSSLMAGR